MARARPGLAVALVRKHPEAVGRAEELMRDRFGEDLAEFLLRAMRESNGGFQVVGSTALAALTPDAEWAPGDVDFVTFAPFMGVAAIFGRVLESEWRHDEIDPEYAPFRVVRYYRTLGGRVDVLVAASEDVVGEVRDKFDLDVCKCGFDGRSVWSAGPPPGGVMARYCQRFTRNEDPRMILRPARRNLKYSARGYRVRCAGHDAANTYGGVHICPGCFAEMLDGACEWAPVRDVAWIVFDYLHDFKLGCGCEHCTEHLIVGEDKQCGRLAETLGEVCLQCSDPEEASLRRGLRNLF